MKAALIVPKSFLIAEDKKSLYHWDEYWEYKSKVRLWSCPSLSLLTVAAMFPADFEVDYIDLNYRDMPDKTYDLALFSPATPQVPAAYELAVKLRAQKTLILMGGPHVSFCLEEAQKYADVVFVGESEETFKTFLEDLQNGQLKPIYRCEAHPDLALCPVPRYELAKDYPYKSIPIQTSRGCPHQCVFCISSSLYGAKFRRKPLNKILEEITLIQKIWKRPFLFFTDDNMFFESRSMDGLLTYLKDAKLRWYCFTDLRVAENPELLLKLASSGCTQLLIGFESLSESNLAQINKSKWKLQKRAYYQKAIADIQSKGVGVVGSFVLGLDGDSPEVFEQLFNFICITKLYATNITILTPFPGTRLFKEFRQDGRIQTLDWSRYNGFELTYTPRNIDAPEFEKGFVNLYEQLNSDERINNLILYFKDIFNSNIEQKRRS
jgi:radical SAM superfamily enzyme YgiQ (UPF0313 family)